MGPYPIGAMVKEDAGAHGNEWFGHVKALFREVGDEAVECDKAAHNGTENVEVGEDDGRHDRGCLRNSLGSFDRWRMPLSSSDRILRSPDTTKPEALERLEL